VTLSRGLQVIIVKLRGPAEEATWSLMSRLSLRTGSPVAVRYAVSFPGMSHQTRFRDDMTRMIV